jgi:uncharacterized protein
MLGTGTTWQPATSAERYRTIDIVRGLALFGVLMVNLLTVFRVPLLEHIFSPHTDSSRVNHLVDLLSAGALEFKALTIFSFLFGVGIAIQIERAESRSVNVRAFLVRRLTWLFVFGIVHLFLVWDGDILTLYAISGLLLLPCLDLPWLALLAIGLVSIVLPEFISFRLALPSGNTAAAQIAEARQIYGNGGYLEILRFRWHECWSLILPLLLDILPRTIGLMYWGMAAWRSGILREPERHRGLLAVTLALGGGVGVILTMNELWAMSSGQALWPALEALNDAAPILLAAAYVSGLLIGLTTTRRSFPLPRIAAAGQMALTNYLLQSVVLGFIFYGYGFDLFGRVGSAAAACIGLLLYAAQVQLSRLWLRHFRFGPFEWLWRSLSYSNRQSFLRIQKASRPIRSQQEP